MKSTKLKIATLALTITVIGGMLSGCKGSTEVTATANKITKPVQIEFWYGLGGKLGETMEAKIKAFNASQQEVIVTGVAQGSYKETYEALQAAIAAKKAPASVLLSYGQMTTLANKKVLASLDEFIKKDKDIKTEDYIPSFYKEGTIGLKQYALPMYGTTQVMYYNKSMLESINTKPEDLKNWEAVYEAAKKMTKVSGKETSVYGFEPMSGADNLNDMALSNGGSFLSEDKKTVTIDSKEWIDSYEAVRKAIFYDKTMRIHSGGQGWEYWYATIADVMQGRAAGYLGSSGDQGDLDFNKLVAAPQPGFNGKKASPVAEALTIAEPAITPKDQQEAAYKWMKYFTSSEQTADWSIKTGYISVRTSATEVAAYKDYAKTHPQILVPITQAKTASLPFIDPTGGKITDALAKAADKVEIQNIPANVALKDAAKEAQTALDAVVNK